MAKPIYFAAASVLMFSCQQPGARQSAPGYDRFAVTEVSGTLDLSGDHRQEKRATSSGDLDLKELRFREELKFVMAGFYYHPKLVEFELETLIGMEQRSTEFSGAASSNSVDGQNYGYDLRILAFKDLPYSAELYTSRHQSFTRQAFFPTSEIIVEEIGVRGKAKEWWIPSTADLRHYTFEGRGTSSYGQTRDQLKMEGRRTEESVQYHYLAEANQIDIHTRSEVTNDLNLNASTLHFFGSENENRLNNTFNFRNQFGDNANSNLNTNTTYDHAWTEHLGSQHSVALSSLSRADNKSQSLTLASNLHHQLFNSLSSGAGVNWSAAKFGEASMNSYGLNGSLAYSKETPLGHLGLSQSLDMLVRNRGSLQGIASVLDESFVYTPGTPIILANIAVDSLSVVVKDTTGLITYTRNVDYFVVELGSQTRIDIPVTSLISSGDNILVDYDFQPTPEQGLQTNTSTTTASLSVSDIASITVGHTTVNQDLVSGFEDGTLENSTRTFAAVNFTPWSTTSLGANFEEYESTFAPFRRMTANFNQGLPIFDRLDWQAAGNTYYVTFGDDPRGEHGMSASTSLFAGLSSSLQASLRAEFHQATYRTDEGRGYMTEFEVLKKLGQTSFTLSASYVDEVFDIATDQSLFRVQFHVTRYF